MSRSRVAIGALFASWPAYLHAQPTFQGLGAEGSGALDVSADGSVVVGGIGTEAFRWTAPTSLVRLGHLPFPYSFCSVALGVSDDGSTVVGCDTNELSEGFPTRAFRWTLSEGMEAIITTTASWGSVALGASFDGSVVVGNSDTVPGGFRWTRSSGAVRVFPTCWDASAITPDASVIVGYASSSSTKPIAGRNWAARKALAAGLKAWHWLFP